MNKQQLKAALIEYINKQDMVDRKYDWGHYIFDCKIIVGSNGSVEIKNPWLRKDEPKKI